MRLACEDFVRSVDGSFPTTSAKAAVGHRSLLHFYVSSNLAVEREAFDNREADGDVSSEEETRIVARDN